MKKVFFAFAAWAVMAQLSLAAITANFVEVTTEAGFSPPAGFKTFDLMVTTDTDWLGSQILLNLSAGTMNQVAGGNAQTPDPFLVDALPNLRWDTYVNVGPSGGDFVVPGGAVDLGGAAGSTFSTTKLDYAWSTTSSPDVGTFSLGRFTFSNNATGTFSVLADALNPQAGPALRFTESGTITGGVIPEPSTIALLAVGIVGAGIGYARKRKTA